MVRRSWGVLAVVAAAVSMVAGVPARAETTTPPANGLIAFTSSEGAGVWAMEADGTDRRLLGAADLSPLEPAWSPDGGWVAFSSYATGGGDIYVMRADGSDLRLVVDDPSTDRFPTWSPDGTQIAFTSVRTGGGDVYVVDNDGANPRQVTAHESGMEMAQDWSPDGSRISFIRTYVNPGGLYTIRPDGTDELTVWEGGFPAGALWSPDGSRIALTRPNDAGTNELVVMNPDGSDPVNYGLHGIEAWAPDGGSILYSRSDGTQHDLIELDLATRETTALTSGAPSETAPTWQAAPVEPAHPGFNVADYDPVSNVVTLGWPDHPDAVGYRLYRSDGPGEPFTVLVTTTAPDFDDPVEPGHRYRYAIAAIGPDGEGTRSLAAIVDTNPPADAVAPSPPRDVSAVADGTKVVVRWSPPADDGGTPLSSYEVTCEEACGQQSLHPSASSMTFSGLAPATTYRFTVTAVNAVGSTSAAPVEATTAGVPGAPTDARAWAADALGAVTVAWSPPATDGGSPVTGYVVRRLDPTGYYHNEWVGPSTTQVTQTGLRRGDTYHYEVIATNAVGWGEPAATGPVTTYAAPSAPTDLQVTPGFASATLEWSPPTSDGGRPLTGYRIYRVGREGPSAVYVGTAPASERRYIDAGLEPGLGYRYFVSATNDLGEGVKSDGVSVITHGLPTEPLDLRAEAGSSVGEIDLSWSAPVTSGGVPLVEYVIHELDADGNRTEIGRVPADDLRFTVRDRSLIFTHTFVVTASNQYGEGPASEAATSRAHPWPSLLDGLS